MFKKIIAAYKNLYDDDKLTVKIVLIVFTILMVLMFSGIVKLSD